MKKSELKEKIASILFFKDYSCKEVNEVLKDIFGNGYSPSTLKKVKNNKQLYNIESELKFEIYYTNFQIKKLENKQRLLIELRDDEN